MRRSSPAVTWSSTSCMATKCGAVHSYSGRARLSQSPNEAGIAGAPERRRRSASLAFACSCTAAGSARNPIEGASVGDVLELRVGQLVEIDVDVERGRLREHAAQLR